MALGKRCKITSQWMQRDLLNHAVVQHVIFLFHAHQSGDTACDTSKKPAATENASIDAFVHYAARRLRLKESAELAGSAVKRGARFNT